MPVVFRNVSILLLALVAGCATYGERLEQARSLAEAGRFEAARDRLDDALDPAGDDRLLYHLEHGAVAHMAGDYRDSIELFARAEQIGEVLFTRRLTDSIRSTLSSPQNSPYRGMPHELAYIHYFQALNYLSLAMEARGRERRRLLDEALVEARKLDARLSELALRMGRYDERNGTADDQTLARVYRGLDPLAAEAISPDNLRFREAAWLRYLSGVLYEMAGARDDARIAYERAADLYESGYASQYDLGAGIVEQARRDAARLTRPGDPRPSADESPSKPTASASASRPKQPVPPSSRKRAMAFEAVAAPETGSDDEREAAPATGMGPENEMAEVVIIQHVDHVPPRDELNLVLGADPWQQSLRIAPWLDGNRETRRYQQAWFRMMYTDTGPAAMLLHFTQGGLPGAFYANFEKRFYLGPLWNELADWGVTDALQTGLRISVPYPGPVPSRPEPTMVRVDGTRHELIPVDDPAMIGYQSMLLEAGARLRAAVARRVFQSVLAERLARELEDEEEPLGMILAAITRAGVAVASEADTRAWQMLPARIHMSRLTLSPGQHRIALEQGQFTTVGNGPANSVTLQLEAGEVRVLLARRMDGSSDEPRPVPKAGRGR